jgi:hypothetical protein
MRAARWTMLLLWTLVAIGACKSAKPTPPPAWPADLMQNLKSFTVQRWRADEPPRSVRVARDASGMWWTETPWRGEADPDALNKIFFVLGQPAILSANAASASDAHAPLSFLIELTKRDGATWRLEVLRAALGAPVPVRVQGVGDFVISPIEFANKIPDPLEFLSPGLWPTSAGAGATLSVTGRVDYKLKALGPEEWVSLDGRKSKHDLEDVAGAITGRQAKSHPEPGPPSAFGLDKPAAVATLCIGAECREFKFGSVERDGKERHYAVGPGQNPIELGDESWRLVVDGPFEPPHK